MKQYRGEGMIEQSSVSKVLKRKKLEQNLKLSVRSKAKDTKQTNRECVP